MEEIKKKENPLGVAPVGKLMVQFAVPSIIAMLVGSIYNIVDQFFIGRTVGILGNSATNIAFPLTTCCVALALLCGVGGASAFNLAMGSGKRDKAPYYVGNAAVALFVGGVLLSLVTLLFLTPLLRVFGAPDDVLPYAQTYVRITAFGFPFLVLTSGGGHLIRADGSPRMTMLCSLSGAAINVVLDAIFVMGLQMGMAGAALATIIGQYFSGGLVIWYLARRFHTVELHWKHLRIHPDVLRRLTSIGTASCFNQLAMLVTQIVMNNSLRYYGGLSAYGESVPLAVAGIVMKVAQLFFGVIIGISQGSQPIESYNYGAKQYDRVRRAYRLALLAGAVVGVVSFLLYMAFPRQILALFGEGSDAYFECGVKFFRIFLFCSFVNFMQPITSTFFTSLGKPLKGVFLSLTRQVIFLIPLMLIFPLFWGIDGILYAGPVADFFAMLAAVIMATVEFRHMHRLELENRA
jgi:putative MATE family efflux protein